jgi:hypothetical protein
LSSAKTRQNTKLSGIFIAERIRIFFSRGIHFLAGLWFRGCRSSSLARFSDFFHRYRGVDKVLLDARIWT